MNTQMIAHICGRTQTRPSQVEAVLRLFDEGATVPFIARYRKEATGELDEVKIVEIREAREVYETLENRRASILASLEERELLNPELELAIRQAETLTALEDLYLPYRPKRRTRGMIAKEAGLEPLAQWLRDRGSGREASPCTILEVEQEASRFTDLEKGIKDASDALAGARDILAEVFNETKEIREVLRGIFEKQAVITAKVVSVKKQDPKAATYRDYFEYSEPASQAPSHRVLAVLRGSDEGMLISHFLPDEEEALAALEGMVLKGANTLNNAAAEQVLMAAQDGYKRLTAPSLENALRGECKERADTEAIRVFSENLRELLLSSPLGQKRVMAVDPGLRTGCKVVCLDAKGDLLHDGVIYPLMPMNRTDEAQRIVTKLCSEYQIEAVAVGNGTGGREAEAFMRQALPHIPVVMVNESGASVYSASEVAREEFPNHDVTVRGAVSIGRRLMDPLAELVKIDPKSIGVGQYQHDVDQKRLRQALDDTTLSCVNSVGVEVNSASRQLLGYVSGIHTRIAKAICSRRESNGVFTSRAELMKVSGMGAVAFQQSAGFLRIRDAVHPLDASAVHPESYPVVERMAEDLGCTIAQLVADAKLRRKIKLERYVSDIVGMPTLKDIMKELEKPGRDPRSQFEVFAFSEEVHEPKDLKEGMVLPGIVTNVTAFGAFVDVGVHQDGLVHISQLADRFVKDPGEVVKVHQKVQVKVIGVDLERGRISLSMKGMQYS